MCAATCLPMRSAALRATAAAGRQLGHVPCGSSSHAVQPRSTSLAGKSLPASLNHVLCTPHGSLLTARLFSSPAGKATEEAAAAGTAEEKPNSTAPSSEEAQGDASAEEKTEGSGTDEKVEPVVLFRAPPLSKDFEDTQNMIDYTAFGSAFGLAAALLGVAPFTAPNTFMVAMMLATVQVRLAHTWQTRVLRAQVRRHVEEIVELEDGRISIKSGHGLQRTLHLSSAAAGGEKPPLSEVMRHGGPFVVIDRTLGTVEAPEALEAMLQSDRSIIKEDLDIKLFAGEGQDEADKVVQSLAKISVKELDNIAKQAAGMATPKAAIGQAASSSSKVAGAILVVGGFICLSGRRQANVPPPGAVPVA